MESPSIRENCGRPLASAPPAPPALPPNAACPSAPPALPPNAACPAAPPASAPNRAGLAHPPSLPPPAGFAPPRRRSRAWVAVVLALVALAVAGVCFFPRGASPTSASERSAAGLQSACHAKDSQAATALIHPAVRASYGKILKDHEAELPRLGKLLATRKLLAANAYVEEYEVIEDGQTFIITFERQGDQWFLAGL